MGIENRFDQPGSLMTKTIDLLKEADLMILYRDTGIPFYWLRTLAKGRYKNPSVNRVQFVYETLTKTKLI